MVSAKGAVRRFTILGCGSSPGVPRIGPDWGNCDPANPKNRRRRASLLIEQSAPDGTTTVVIDTGPDFRQQMIDADVHSADGVVYTHAHADHIHGIDDLRGFVINRRERVNIWATKETSDRLHQAFSYCFQTPKGSQYPPLLDEHRITIGQEFAIDGQGGCIPLTPIEQQHGGIKSLGFRIGALAYCSDISDFDKTAVAALQDLDVLIIDALQYREHPSHLSLEQALSWIEKLKPKRAILTHMHIALDYETVLRETPDNVEPAYDGMTVDLKIT